MKPDRDALFRSTEALCRKHAVESAFVIDVDGRRLGGTAKAGGYFGLDGRLRDFLPPEPSMPPDPVQDARASGQAAFDAMHIIAPKQNIFVRLIGSEAIFVAASPEKPGLVSLYEAWPQCEALLRGGLGLEPKV